MKIALINFDKITNEVKKKYCEIRRVFSSQAHLKASVLCIYKRSDLCINDFQMYEDLSKFKLSL